MKRKTRYYKDKVTKEQNRVIKDKVEEQKTG